MHPDLLLERDCGPSSEKINLDSRPPLGRPHQDLLLGEEPVTLYRPLLTMDHVISYVLEHLAYV